MKFYLRRVYLDSGGYTYGKYPTYFGRGTPLYEYYNDDVCGNVRGSDREAAKDAVRQAYPDAEFYK